MKKEGGMATYKSTTKYRLLSYVGILTGCMLSLSGLFSFFTGTYISLLLMLFPGITLLYLLFYVFPDRIVVHEEGFEFIAKLRNVKMDYSEIKCIKPHYTTRTLTLTGGGKEEAAVYYSIKRVNKPMCLLMFGSGIHKYRELYDFIKTKVGKKGQ